MIGIREVDGVLVRRILPIYGIDIYHEFIDGQLYVSNVAKIVVKPEEVPNIEQYVDLQIVSGVLTSNFVSKQYCLKQVHDLSTVASDGVYCIVYIKFKELIGDDKVVPFFNAKVKEVQVLKAKSKLDTAFKHFRIDLSAFNKAEYPLEHVDFNSADIFSNWITARSIELENLNASHDRLIAAYDRYKTLKSKISITNK
jgi:hypothetical protein